MAAAAAVLPVPQQLELPMMLVTGRMDVTAVRSSRHAWGRAMDFHAYNTDEEFQQVARWMANPA